MSQLHCRRFQAEYDEVGESNGQSCNRFATSSCTENLENKKNLMECNFVLFLHSLQRDFSLNVGQRLGFWAPFPTKPCKSSTYLAHKTQS